MVRKLICKTCEKPFSSNIVRENGYTALFCSRACIKPKIQKICAKCKKPYFVIPYRAEKSRWCSKECLKADKPAPQHTYSTKEWQDARRKALERDNYTCQKCGVKNDEKTLHVNHIIPYRIIRSHILANLVTLCITCHPNMDWMVRDLIGPHPARMRFLELIGEMWLTNLRKSDNYAQDQDPLSNLKGCERIGVPASIGAMVRMGDKWSRLEQLMSGKRDLVGESIKDTLVDLSIYCLLEVILLEREEARQQSTTQSSQPSQP